MEQKISTIKKVELKKDDMQGMIMLDRGLGEDDLKFLESEFDLYKEHINKFVANYRNRGIVFKLKPIQQELSKDWERFLSRVIKKGYEFDRFNNIFVNKAYSRILVITNKRLLKLDLQRLNEKIEETNYSIESYDEKLEAEAKEFEKETMPQKRFFTRIIEAWKK